LNLNTEQQSKLKDYLLGRLPEAELEAIDERLVTDGDFYEEILIAEDELIDQYLNKELNESDRKSFEEFFLISPERRAKLQFSDSFMSYLNPPVPVIHPEPDPVRVTDQDKKAIDRPPWYQSFLPVKSPALAYSLMSAVVLLVVAGSWLAWSSYQQRGVEAGPVYTAELLPGGPSRSGGVEKKITIPPGTGTVEFKLDVKDDGYGLYRGVLIGGTGAEIWHNDNLQLSDSAGTKVVIARIPAKSLPPGDYRLRLSGQTPPKQFEDLATYSFRIIS